MSNDEPEIIDVQAEEIVETPNLPAVIEDTWNAEALEADSVTRSNGKTYKAKPGRSADGVSLDTAAAARHDAALANNPERRCVRMTPKGQCRKFAILGSTVCRTHGGAAKQVVNKARVRVEMASNKLVGKLIEFAFDDTKPPDTQLRAIRDALDRSGLRPPAEVVLSQGEPKPYEELFEGIAEGSRAESRRARGVPDSQDDYAGFDATAEPSVSSSFAHPEDGGSAEYNRESPPATVAQAHSPPAPPRPSRPRQDGRERDAGPPVQHITGEDAIRAANQANREIGAMKAIESGGHKRYRRP